MNPYIKKSPLIFVVFIIGTASWLGGESPAMGGGELAQEVDTTQGWRQWGGPHRNFMSDSTGLASSWPAEGPQQLWKRELGEGHSSIAVDEGRLFTMYRPLGASEGNWIQEEVVIALEAGSGRTLWEHKYPSPTDGLNFRHGAGPHSTPLVLSERIFTAGTNKQIYALEKSTGKVVWFHDLVNEFNAPPTLIRPAVKAGFGVSLLEYEDTVVVTSGAPDASVIAFNQEDGSVAWKNLSINISPASPILIRVAGQEQLVVFGGKEVYGLDPGNGRLLWKHPHNTRGDMNISTPIWGDDNLLFLSSAYDGGSRVLRLSRGSDGTTVDELWFSRRLRVHIGTVIRLGDYVYGSSGDFGPSFITALHIKTGEVAWQDRRFSRSTFLYADGKLIILDEDGILGLATVSPEGLNVMSKAQVLRNVAWTVPTLVETTLYARDRATILALELGEP